MKEAISKNLSETFLHAFGLYTALLVAFNKGFTYTRSMALGVPVFVTELVLISFFIVYFVSVARKKSLFLPEDKWFLVCFLGFFVTGFYAFLTVPSYELSVVVPSLKRFALFYYSFFTFFLIIFLKDISSIYKLLSWMFWGATAATLISLWENLFGLPKWWPTSVGISSDTAKWFCVLFAVFLADLKKPRWLYHFIGSLAFSMLVYTSRRSAVLALLVSFAVYWSLSRKMPDHQRTFEFGRLGLTTLLFCTLLSFKFGAPPFLQRMGLIPVDRRPIEAAVQSPVPVQNVPASQIIPAGPQPQLKNSSSAPAPAPRSQANVPPAAVQGPIAKPKIRPRIQQPKADLSLPIPFNKMSQGTLVKFLDKHIFSKRGGTNIGWRIKVGLDAFEETLRSNFLLGVGIYRPMIAVSVCPYNRENLPLAAYYLSKKLNFYNRLRDTSVEPSANVEPGMPLQLNPEEKQKRETSQYWFDIDLHNSHLAVFYRFGLLGILSYLGLFSLNWKKLSTHFIAGNPYAKIMILYFIWYAVVSSANVVLEGPFMGALFWIFLGLSLRYAFLLDPAPQKKQGAPQPEMALN